MSPPWIFKSAAKSFTVWWLRPSVANSSRFSSMSCTTVM